MLDLTSENSCLLAVTGKLRRKREEVLSRRLHSFTNGGVEVRNRDAEGVDRGRLGRLATWQVGRLVCRPGGPPRQML